MFGFDDEIVNIKFAKANENAIIPTRSEGSAGLDVYACFNEDYIEVPALATKLIPTGIKSVIDAGYVALIEERGSTGSKGIKKSAGVIDANFRGEWFIAISNMNTRPLFISKLNNEETRKKAYPDYFEDTSDDAIICYPYTKAIAQALILPVPKLIIKECSQEEIDNAITSRGNGMLGSSGK